VGTRLAHRRKAPRGQQWLPVCKEGKLLKWKLHGSGKLTLYQPHPPPTYNTNNTQRNTTDSSNFSSILVVL
jgi:hypothetical protein